MDNSNCTINDCWCLKLFRVPERKDGGHWPCQIQRPKQGLHVQCPTGLWWVNCTIIVKFVNPASLNIHITYYVYKIQTIYTRRKLTQNIWRLYIACLIAHIWTVFCRLTHLFLNNRIYELAYNYALFFNIPYLQNWEILFLQQKYSISIFHCPSLVY